MIIYKITNVATNRIYIGATTSSAQARLSDHFTKSRKAETKLQVAMLEYPKECFEVEQIDTAETINELAQKERYYIEQYDSFRNGYNSDGGGGVQKTVYQFEIDGTEPIASYDSLAEAGEAVGASRKSISNACLGYNNYCKGFKWSYEPVYYTVEVVTNKKQVTQYDLEGNIINTFESAREASRQLGIGISSITRCCRGERNQTSSYKFSY